MDLRSGGQKDAARPEHYGRLGQAFFVQNARGPRTRRSLRKRGRDPAPPVDAATEAERQARTSLPSPYQAERLTRSDKIRCTHYGPERAIMFPRHFFCGKCKEWEDEEGFRRKNAKRDSTRNECDATHSDPTFPTQLKTGWCPSRNLGYCQPVDDPDLEIVLDDISDCSSDTSLPDKVVSTDCATLPPTSLQGDATTPSQPPTTSAPLFDVAARKSEGLDVVQAAVDTLSLQLDVLVEDLQSWLILSQETAANLETHVGILTREVKQLQLDKQSLKLKNNLLSRQIKATKRSVRRHTIPQASEETSLQDHIRHSLDVAMATHHHGRRSKQFGTALAEVAFDYREGIAHQALFDHVKDFLRREVFNPYRVARLMDIHGGTLNLLALELIRSLKTNGKKYVRGTIMPSTNDMRLAFAKVERLGDILAPYEISALPDGEAVAFDYEKMIRLIFKSFQLDNAALERNVALSVSIDGATLTRFLSHVMAGFKIKDKSAIDPLTGLPLYNAGEGWTKLQSRHTCFPLHLHMGSENKNKYKEYSTMYDFFHNHSSQTSAVGLGGPGGWRPFNISMNTDLSGIWKALGRGGGARTYLRPCHCCAVHRDEQHKQNEQKCNRCILNHDDDESWQCFHRRMITDHVLENMQDELKTLVDAMQYQMEQVKDSQLTMEDPTHVEGNESSFGDPKSVWYNLNNRTTRERLAYSRLLDSELKLRGVDNPVGGLSARQDQLRAILQQEWPIRKLTEDINASERPETALFLLLQAIPCVLHMENRVSLKMMTMLLIDGVSAAVEGTLFGDINSEVSRVDAYIKSVQNEVNQTILGSPTHPAQWRFPYDPVTKKVGTITLENWRCRRVMEEFERLVEVSVPELEPNKTRWLRMLPKFRGFMKQARAKDDWNTPEEIEAFQQQVDDWFQDWQFLHGKACVTNYIHMLASGHVSEYVFNWGNLYEHSQQGWEAFNALVKSFFFRRSPHGGGKTRSRLKPIARWLQRRAIWLCGYDEATIDEYLDRLDNEEFVEQQLEALGEREDEDDFAMEEMFHATI